MMLSRIAAAAKITCKTFNFSSPFLQPRPSPHHLPLPLSLIPQLRSVKLLLELSAACTACGWHSLSLSLSLSLCTCVALSARVCAASCSTCHLPPASCQLCPLSISQMDSQSCHTHVTKCHTRKGRGKGSKLHLKVMRGRFDFLCRLPPLIAAATIQAELMACEICWQKMRENCSESGGGGVSKEGDSNRKFACSEERTEAANGSCWFSSA